jgi:signal transduction histidine kinase
MSAEETARRAEELFEAQRDRNVRRTSRLFMALMVGQWLFGIVVALIYSPYAWSGKTQVVHVHVWAALILGGLITSLPVFLAWKAPGATATRYIIAVGQMLWSALLIHLTGGRIETHFHVFGSLAFLAYYRDWRVLVPATIVVATDHFLRGMYWPESVYGIANPEWWRFLEHAFWVVFEDTILILFCIETTNEMREVAERRAEVEILSEREREKSAMLDKAMAQLTSSQEQMVRTERLAAVGQLAASVGHELRNPLAAVRNANTFIVKRLGDGAGKDIDPKVPQFLAIIDRELGACNRIIGDLLDFARERPVMLAPCPLHALVDEAIGLLPKSAVTVHNEVHLDVVPELDREQFRQIVINLLQNAVEAVNAAGGKVAVRAEIDGAPTWRMIVEDSGPGIAPEVVGRIFEPLFTTKTKGTGLGLAIVQRGVALHNGTIKVESTLGQGTRFIIDLPRAPARPSVEAS